MNNELLEIRQHLQRHPPFDQLSDEWLDRVSENIDVAYYKAGSQILDYDQPVESFYYIRSGAVEVFRRNGMLYNRLDEGNIFGHFNLLRNRRVKFPVKAIEDTLLYLIPAATFDQLCESDNQFADFVELEKPRLESSVEQQQKSNDMLITRARTLISTRPLLVHAETSVGRAAQLASEQGGSAFLVVEQAENSHKGDPRFVYQDDQQQRWQLLGIFTNSDFRNQVVAQRLSPDTTIGELIHKPLISIQSDESLHEAMLVMLRNNINHLAVMQKQRPLGIIHLSDIIRYETRSSAYLVNNIYNQQSATALARLLPDVRASFIRMTEEGADFYMTGQALSTIGRAFTRRLLELAEARLGPPPVPYAFMAAGSMARNEQGIVTDQDNALVISDDFVSERHDDYFFKLVSLVSDGLAECGYTYCKGEIMATNPRWRQPVSVWKQYFRQWMDEPSPERLLQSSIFFDLDAVAGEASFVEELQALIANEAGKRPLFLAAMARNALNRTPPLGFFRTFVVEKDGRQNEVINIKGRGTAPVTDLIRVHALACGSLKQNSFERLDDIANTQLLAPGVADKLKYALEIMGTARNQHQAAALKADKPPDNYLMPERITDQQRHNLKEAFQVVNLAQKFLKFRYPMPARRR